jgi:exodeoxyribonuclease V alpha subunit
MQPLTKTTDLEPDPEQLRAIRLIATGRERLSIITGGPGTGKTTIVKEALRHPGLAGKRVSIVAPTGKAAKRIRDVIGSQTSTLHRLLGYNGTSFQREEEFIPADVILVDESSMVDVWLGYELVSAVKPGARIILVGDADQLPSVGAGSLLRDLIDSGEVPVVQLQTLHRSAQTSWVCTNAPKILRGEMFDTDGHEDFAFHETSDIESTVDVAVEVVLHHQKDFWDGHFQLLTPQNIGDLGTELLNNILAGQLNPRRNQLPQIEVSSPKATMQSFIAPNDRVIQVVNNYQSNVFNGEIGTVDRFEDKKVFVRFEGKIVSYSIPSASRELRLAYALTVHKSQGSEWKHVAVICHGAHRRMWSRQLLYTGVTRSKKSVYIIGNNAGVQTALAQNNPRERFTTLLHRLAETG